jgi:hypothetical protein
MSCDMEGMLSCRQSTNQKILLTAKVELTRHTWDTFVDDPHPRREAGEGL